MASTSSSNPDPTYCCFLEWLNLQESDLSQLLHALTLWDTHHCNTHELTRLAHQTIKHFQDYADKRSFLARNGDVSALFVPNWCSSLENSLLWIAGCRPTLFIRLIYALCGSEIESKLSEFLAGVRTGKLSELSAKQLGLINGLQAKTISEEDSLSSRMASLQEEIADYPFAVIAKESSRVGELNREIEKALNDHAEGMASMLEEADKLRLSTLKELIGILTPVQAVEFLAAAKKLHLSVHEWGKKRDQQHGRNIETK